MTTCPEQAVDQALTALLENKPTTITRTDLAAQYQDLRTAAGEAIKARLAASQPAHYPTRTLIHHPTKELT